MHVLITTTPFAGHQPPLVGLGRELVQRGHRVTYYTGHKYRGSAQLCAAAWLPWQSAQDFDDDNPQATFPRMSHGDGVGAVMDSFDRLYFQTGPGQLADVARLHAADPVDVVIGENLCLAAPFLHDAQGVPWVSFSLSPLVLSSSQLPPGGLGLRPGAGPLGRLRDAALRFVVDHTLGARMRTLLNRARHQAGLAPTSLNGLDSLHSPRLHLAQGIPALEFNRTDLPASVHLIGDAARGTRTEADPPRWLEQLDPGRPIVHVTAGTVDTTGALYRSAITALAGSDIQVVASGDPALVPPARNVIAPGWVPHDLLLPRCAALVSNGGYGAVLSSLAAGVPVLVAPAGRDKPEVATRVALSGAGVNLQRREPAPATLRHAVEQCLVDPTYRLAAAQAAAAFARAGGAARAADLVEESAP